MTDENAASDDEQEDASERGASSPAPAEGQSTVASGKRFREARPDELDPQSFMVADERAALRVRLFGGSVQGVRARADFIGATIRRVARALREAAEAQASKAQAIGDPMLVNAELGKSIVIEIEVGSEEDIQYGLDGTPDSPTIRAARTLGQLLAAPADDLVQLALALGPDAATEYKRLLDTLGGDEVTIEWLTPRATRYIVATSADVRRDYLILDRPGEERVDTVSVPGTLTMADSRRNRFELSLPSGATRPPLLKGKSVVDGMYDEDVGVRLKAEGLWDTEVMAEIEVTYDEQGTTPVPRAPKYRLLSAEALVPPASTDSMF